MKKMVAGIVTAVLIGVGSTAHAVPFVVDSSGDSTAVNFSNNIIFSGNTYTLSATALMTASAFSAGSMTLDITLTNTTVGNQNGVDLTGKGGVSVHGMGWNMDPNATGISFLDPQGADDGIVNATLNSVFPGFQVVDVCAWAGNNCSGGANNKNLLIGESDSFQVRLTGIFGGAVTIDPTYIRYMGSLGSFTFQGNGGGGGGGGFQRVPEPATLLLLGSGLLGLGLVRRRKAQR